MNIFRNVSCLILLFSLGSLCDHASLLEALWVGPTTVSTSPSQDQAVAIAPSANATVLWQQNDGRNYRIGSAQLLCGQNWTPPLPYVSAPGYHATVPQAALDAAGNTTAVWTFAGLPNTVIQSATLPLGGSWSSVSTISLEGGDADGPHVAVDSAGNAVAVWFRYNGFNTIVQAATCLFGGSWSAPVDVSAPGENAGDVRVAVDKAGNATAIWTRSDGLNNVIQSSTLPFGSDSWTTPITISQLGQDAETPKIALDAAGNVYAVWSRFDGTNFIIQSAVLPFGGSWSGPVDLSIPGSDGYTPFIAVAPNGYAVAVWYKDTGLALVIQAATRSTLGIWSQAVDISDPTGYAFIPEVAVDASGNATAVWEAPGFNAIIQSATLPFGGSWSMPVSISTQGDDSTIPHVVMDPSGFAVIIWLDFTYQGNQEVIQAVVWAPPPAITNVSPNKGSCKGENVVLIEGTNLSGATRVKFGKWNALSFSVLSCTQIEALAPPQCKDGPVDITVTTGAGTSTVVSKGRYFYNGCANSSSSSSSSSE